LRFVLVFCACFLYAVVSVEVAKYVAVEAQKRMLAGKKVDPVQKVAQGSRILSWLFVLGMFAMLVEEVL